MKEGGNIDWDVLFRTAHLHYYRVYFLKDQEREAEIKTASGWILRAIIVNPKHVDLTMKYADVLNMSGNYAEAVAVLERLVAWPEAPVIAKQWLGAFLLRIPGKLDRSIEVSEIYFKEFPEDYDALLTIVRAYGQKYCAELTLHQKTSEPDSGNRKQVLSLLPTLLQRRPRYAERIRSRLMAKGRSFECFVSDRQFCEMIGLPLQPSVESAGSAPPKTVVPAP